MTEKNMKKQLKRIWYHLDHLQSALNWAHHTALIKYPSDQYNELAPCYSMAELRERIRQTTKDKIAEVITQEMRK